MLLSSVTFLVLMHQKAAESMANERYHFDHAAQQIAIARHLGSIGAAVVQGRPSAERSTTAVAIAAPTPNRASTPTPAPTPGPAPTPAPAPKPKPTSAAPPAPTSTSKPTPAQAPAPTRQPTRTTSTVELVQAEQWIGKESEVRMANQWLRARVVGFDNVTLKHAVLLTELGKTVHVRLEKLAIRDTQPTNNNVGEHIEEAVYGDPDALKNLLAKATTRLPVQQPTPPKRTAATKKSKHKASAVSTTTKAPGPTENVTKLLAEIVVLVKSAKAAYKPVTAIPEVPAEKEPQFDTHADAYKSEDEADKKAGFTFKEEPLPTAADTARMLDEAAKADLLKHLKSQFHMVVQKKSAPKPHKKKHVPVVHKKPKKS